MFQSLLKMVRKPLFLSLLLLVIGGAFVYAAPQSQPAGAAEAHEKFVYFSFLSDDKFSSWERTALFVVMGVALAGIAYALMLIKQVKGADQGTPRMQEIARAIREGADAYLKKQLTTVAVLIVVLFALLYISKAVQSGWDNPFALGRAMAFLMGAVFSATVGFVGMRMATIGNLRVAAGATKGFGNAMMLGYRTGTITGMLCDGLGLLGGTLIFMTYGEHAYEALLGFGFGGTLLALFMRVGGGIFTKAADVGADLVGKVEKDIPEDDPRNAATIADNVGDNVGDCAGMAADIFESYEVDIVAAMILGWATFGHMGVIFPILVRAIGVFGSIISTYSVRAGDKGSVTEAMKAINFGFIFGSVLSVIGFIALGCMYLHYNHGMVDSGAISEELYASIMNLPAWANFGTPGLDMRPALCCLVGVILCITLNRVTEYFTGTDYRPVQDIKRNCRTGHGTCIIEGFAVGYESAVWTAIVLCVAISASVLIFTNTTTNPLFIAYGVAMTGIGMLTLTGNTVSMDVFGPVADNANGIAEMGFDRKEMGEEKYKECRQTLSDLDAVGNTTKAVTKGVAIGSAVIASVSLYASFITVLGTGGGGENAKMPASMYEGVSAMLTVSNPKFLVGMLIGGSVPFLFSSMLIRAVSRAAYLIVFECRAQFRDKAIWEGTKKPDYGRVVSICTATAQKELIGPAMLGVFFPLLVGLLLGPIGMAGFLGGAIVAGQLLASFMCNAGGAWDNAKKMVEDDPRDLEKNTGKGSEMHKASVTGDTVGDPLKDTAGPAINPLLKVMNMVSVLTIGLLMVYDKVVVDKITLKANDVGFDLPKEFVHRAVDAAWVVAVVVCLACLTWAMWQSKRQSPEMAALEKEVAST